MDIIYLLIPISLMLVVVIIYFLFWAIRSGQFEDLEGSGHRILMDDDRNVVDGADKTDEDEQKPA
jgi:cbb3-type cytochrome oxidase maturation protein